MHNYLGWLVCPILVPAQLVDHVMYTLVDIGVGVDGQLVNLVVGEGVSGVHLE
jgi:hypothetical protein